MRSLKKYLAGFCPVQDITNLALCLIKPKFSLLPALWEIMDCRSGQLEAKVSELIEVHYLSMEHPHNLIMIIRMMSEDNGHF